MAKSKSHNTRNSSGRFAPNKTLKQKAQDLWIDFWCAVDGMSKFRLFMAFAAFAVVLWLIFGK